MSDQLSMFSVFDAAETTSEKSFHKRISLVQSVDEYVCFDIETNKFGNDLEIVEIGAVRIKNGQSIAEFSQLVRPAHGMSESASKKNGITDAMLEDCPSIGEVLPSFRDFIDNSVLVVYNSSFYIFHTKRIFADMFGLPFDNSHIDAMALSKSILPCLDNHRLETVSNYFGIHNDQAHRALSDAICTAQLYEKLKPYIIGGNALPESCAFGGYDYNSILESIRRMVGDDGSTVTLTVNKDFATVYMFKKKAFSIRLDVREPYIESDKSICFDFVPRINKARQLKNTARFTVASSPDDVPAIEEMILAMYNYFADRQTNYSMMACCNDFVRCSDALECLHKYDEEYAGCWYRKNLEKGRVFYGKNRNV